MDERNWPRQRPYGSRDPYPDPNNDPYTEGYYDQGYAEYDTGYGAPTGGQMYGPPQSGGRMYGPPPGPAGYSGPAGYPGPDFDDDYDDDQPTRSRRKMLLALGGGAIVMAGGGAVAASQLLADKPKKTANNAQPDGYSSENESYMGSEAGLGVMKNTPSNGVMYGSPSEAAANTIVTAKTVLNTKDPIRHLASRLTFGPTPKVLADIKSMGIDAWINKQLNPSSIPLTKGEQKLEAELTGYKMAPRELFTRREELNTAEIRPEEENVRYAIGKMIWSDRQLFEMMVDFWNDFLHVSAYGDEQNYYRAAFDREVIRKHALGSYTDMFLAANRHPALIKYLDQDQSSKRNINENLARENLELYTVGVNGGYTEFDVRRAAELQTGRGIENQAYIYRAGNHFTHEAVGGVKIMGFKHANATAEGGEAAQDAYFRYLAGHPSTARYVAQQLATRFVSDVPPNSLVDRMAKAYLANKTKIAPVLMVMLRSSEFWGAVGQKVRRPVEYIVATYRTLGVSPDATAGASTGFKRGLFQEGLRDLRVKMEEMGQFPMGQATPNGYADVFPAWTSAGSMINGWNEAIDAVQGSRKQFSYIPANQLVARPPTTAGVYIDALCQRLVHQTFMTQVEKNELLKVAGPGFTNSTKVDANFNGALVAIVRTILAAPHHHLR